MTGPTHTVYAGRFRFDLPEGFEMTGQDSTVRGVSVVVVDLPTNVPPEQARAAYWQKHLDEVRETLKLDDLPLTIEEGEARPGMPQAFHRARTDLDWTMEALLYGGPRTVLLKKDWRDHYDAKQVAAFHALSRQRFNEAVAAFHFLPVGVAPNPEWFYVEGGALAFPPVNGDRDAHDNVVIGFLHKPSRLKIHVDVSYPSLGDDDGPGLAERLVAAIAEWKMNVETIRSGARVLSGLKGHEALFRLKEKGALSLSWAFEPERSARGYAPYVVIDADTSDASTDEQIAAWDSFLAGVHPLISPAAK